MPSTPRRGSRPWSASPKGWRRGGNPAIPGREDARRHLVGVGDRLADVDVAANRNRSGSPAVGLATLEVERRLVARLVERERWRREKAVRESSGAVDGRACAGADPELDVLGRTEREASVPKPEAAG